MAISNERTRRTMRDVRLPVIDWPEQPLTERLTLIEKELVNHGIAMEISEVRPDADSPNELSRVESQRYSLDCGNPIHMRCDDIELQGFGLRCLAIPTYR